MSSRRRSFNKPFKVAFTTFAAFFEPFAAAFDAPRAQVSLVFGLSGLIYFVAGAGGGLSRHLAC